MKDCLSLHTLYSTLYTFHSTLHTLHFTLQTLHFTLYTLPFTLYTLRSTLYTLHCTLPPQQSLSTPYCNDSQPAGSSSTRSPPPCKLSCSEPQRTLLSVELRSSSIFLRFPPDFNDFPSFSVIFSYLFPAVPPFSSIFPPVLNDFPSFSLVFSCLFPAGVNGPRGNRSLPSSLRVVVHALQKTSICTASAATNFELPAPHATSTPQTP